MNKYFSILTILVCPHCRDEHKFWFKTFRTGDIEICDSCLKDIKIK